MEKSKKKLIILIAFILSLGFGISSYAENLSDIEDDGKIQDIKKLMEITKARELIKKSMNENMAVFSKAYPNFPEDSWYDILGDREGKVLYETALTVYDKSLTRAEVQNMIDFYSSREYAQNNPASLSLVIKMRDIMQKAVEDLIKERIKKLKPALEEYGYVVSEVDLFKQLVISSGANEKAVMQEYSE